MRTRAAVMLENVVWAVIFAAFAAEVVYAVVKWMEPR